MGEKRNIRRPEENIPLGRPRHIWEGNIKLYLKEMGWQGMDNSYVVKVRDNWQAVVNMPMNLQVP
jgi:hypothetical protein